MHGIAGQSYSFGLLAALGLQAWVLRLQGNP